MGELLNCSIVLLLNCCLLSVVCCLLFSAAQILPNIPPPQMPVFPVPVRQSIEQLSTGHGPLTANFFLFCTTRAEKVYNRPGDRGHVCPVGRQPDSYLPSADA